MDENPSSTKELKINLIFRVVMAIIGYLGVRLLRKKTDDLIP